MNTKKHIYLRLNPVSKAIMMAFGLLSLHAPTISFAETATENIELPTVNVTATVPRLNQITDDAAALPASTTVLTAEDLDQQVINTYGDIFRGVTGVSVVEYGQGLLAYEVKFRGFTSAHGKDVAAYLDGVPLNITGSQQANGYMDQAQIIPELLNRVEVVRGPFSAYAGNHAVAGSIQMFTDREVASSIKMSVDNFGRVRALPIFSTVAGPGKLLLALDLTKGDGYTEQSDLERINFFSRYVLPVGDGDLALRFQSYHADADAPGYLLKSRIKSGERDKDDALAKGLGDKKTQNNLVLSYKSNDSEGKSGMASGWSSSAYIVRDKRERFAYYNFALPAFSAQDLESDRDRLNQLGLDVRKVTTLDTPAMPSQLSLGVQLNRESIDALGYLSDASHHLLPNGVLVDRTVLTTTKSAYGQLQVQPFSALKVTLGARYDDLDFDIKLRPEDDTFASATAAGVSTKISASANKISPKIGFGLEVYNDDYSTAALYGNYAKGLKSPYAFRDFYSNLAVSSEVPNLNVSTLRSTELGMTGGAKNNLFNWRAGIWDTRQEDEADRGANGFFQNFGETKRRGFDLEASMQVSSNTQVFANYSKVYARSLTAPSATDYLTNIPEWTATLGLNSSLNFASNKLDISLEDTITGPQSLNTDNSLRGKSYNRLSLLAALTNTNLKGASFYTSLVHNSSPLQEQLFDAGGGEVGVAPRPRWLLNVGTKYVF